MQLFLDTADLDQIRCFAGSGLVDGVTTNPSLIAKAGQNIRRTIAEICALIPGPVSAEVTATEAPQMIAEGRSLAGIAENVVIKLPLTWAGLSACRTLTDQGHAVNVTLCFSAVQALLAAKAGAAFISPFIGRIDDNGGDGVALLEDIRDIYDAYEFETEILAASIRSMDHVRQAALAAADAATIPPAVFGKLMDHVLTEKGLEGFLQDWESAGQSILPD